METLVEFALIYVAIRAIFFALIPGQALSLNFHWRNQAESFRDSLPEVLAWPVALWRLCPGQRFFRLGCSATESLQHLF
ncbi:MAG: hypothetical protein WA633_01075, partial [Stellaceae bacterium]